MIGIMLVVGALTVTLFPPDGTRFDLTDRIDLGDIGQISEALEDNLTELTHSDFDLTIQDSDGLVAGLLRNSKRSETWELRVERFTGERRIRWDLVFSGILDVPLSVEIDRKNKTVSVQVFSYSKLLETIDVESLRRTEDVLGVPLAAQIASGSSGGSTITLLPGLADSFFYVGDVIALDDGQNREEHTVNNSTGVILTTVENLQNDFTNARIELLTPWPREQSISEAVLSLLELADINDVSVDIDSLEGLVPFLSAFVIGAPPPLGPLQIKSLHAEDDADLSGNSYASAWVNLYGSKTSTSYFRAADALSGFEQVVVSAQAPNADWTPYMDAEPAALETVPDDVQDDRQTDTQLNFGHVLHDDVDWVAAYDHDGTDTWTLRADYTIGSDPRIKLYLNGSLAVLNVHVDTAGGGGDVFESAFLDFFPAADLGFANDLAVISYEDSSGNAHVNVYDGSSLTTVSTSNGGGGVRTIMQRGVVAIQDSDGSGNQPNVPGDINFWEPIAASPFLQVKKTLSNQPVMQMWTMRSFGDYIACMYLADAPTPASDTGFQKRATRIRIWRWETLEQVGDYQLLEFAHPDMYMTRVTVGGVESLAINIGRFMFLLSSKFSGAVPYMNLDDVSGAAAVKDLALVTLSHVEVDRFKIGRVRGRASQAGTEHEIDTDALIEDAEQPLTDDYSGSIEVTGKDRSGQEFSVVVGDKHDANRETIDSDLIRDTGLAQSIGAAYFDLLAGVRRERNVTRKLDRTWMHANDLAKIDNVPYRVISAETDLGAGEQDLKLVEVLR